MGGLGGNFTPPQIFNTALLMLPWKKSTILRKNAEFLRKKNCCHQRDFVGPDTIKNIF